MNDIKILKFQSTTLLSEHCIAVCYNETKEPVYKSVRECRYRLIRKLETRNVNLKGIGKGFSQPIYCCVY